MIASSTRAASPSHLRLVVSNDKYHPAAAGDKLRALRHFRSRFRLISNQGELAPRKAPAPVQPVQVGPTNCLAVNAFQFADWLERTYREQSPRNPRSLEVMIYLERMPADAVYKETVQLMHSRGFTLGRVNKQAGSASVSVVSRYR